MIEALCFMAGLTLLGSVASQFWFSVHRTLLFHLATVMVLPVYLFRSLWGEEWPRGLLAVAVAAGCVIAVSVGTTVLNFLFFGELHRGSSARFAIRTDERGVRPTAATVISLGLHTMAIASIALVWSSQPFTLIGCPHVGGTALLASVMLCGGAVLLLRRTALGLRIRAVADSPDAAGTFGVDPRSAHAGAILLGAMIAGVMGFLIAAGGALVPSGGFRWLLAGGASMIIGGANLERGLFPRQVVSAFFFAITLAATAWWLGAEWSEGVTFLLLLGSILWRPRVLSEAHRIV